MTVVFMLLFLAALVCFALAALGVRVGTRGSVELLAVGLAFWVLVPLIKAVQVL